MHSALWGISSVLPKDVRAECRTTVCAAELVAFVEETAVCLQFASSVGFFLGRVIMSVVLSTCKSTGALDEIMEAQCYKEYGAHSLFVAIYVPLNTFICGTQTPRSFFFQLLSACFYRQPVSTRN